MLDHYSQDEFTRLQILLRSLGYTFIDVQQAVLFAEKHGWKPNNADDKMSEHGDVF